MWNHHYDLTLPFYSVLHPWIKNYLADCLSWLGSQKDHIKLTKLHLYQITHQLCARYDSLNQLRITMQEDDKLALLKHTIVQGCPNTTKEVSNVLQPYWPFRGDLTAEDDLVLKGTRIAIPTKK